MPGQRSPEKVHIGAYVPREMNLEIEDIAKTNNLPKTHIITLMLAAGIRHFKKHGHLQMIIKK